MANLVNLDRKHHQNLRVEEEHAFAACKDVPMCAVVLSEIPRLVIEYPHGIHEERRNRAVRLRRAFWGGSGSQPVLARWALEQLHRATQCRKAAVFRRDRRESGWWRRRERTGHLHRSRQPGRAGDGRRSLVRRSAGGELPICVTSWRMLNELIDGEERARGFHREARFARPHTADPARLKTQAPAAQDQRAAIRSTRRKMRALDAATFTDLHAAGYLHAMYAMMSSLGPPCRSWPGAARLLGPPTPELERLGKPPKKKPPSLS